MKKEDWKHDWWIKLDDDPTAVYDMNQALTVFERDYPMLAEGRTRKITIRRGRNIFFTIEPREIDGKRVGYIITANGKKSFARLEKKELWSLVRPEDDGMFYLLGWFGSLKQIAYRLITDIQYDLSVKAQLKRCNA